jgi:hypothetical protein
MHHRNFTFVSFVDYFQNLEIHLLLVVIAIVYTHAYNTLEFIQGGEDGIY